MKLVKNVLANAHRTITTSLLFAAMLSLMINPLTKNINFHSFDRVFGNATLVGIDASARISNFTIFNVLFVPLCLVISMLACYWFTRNVEHDKNGETTSKTKRLLGKKTKTVLNEEAFPFLEAVSLCALVLAVTFIINKYNNQEAFNCFANYGIQIAFIFIFATLIYIKHPFLPFELFRFAMFISFGITLFVNFIFQNNTSESNGMPVRFGIIFLVVTLLTLVVLHQFKVTDFERLKLAFVPMSFGMLLVGLALELCNILNQHGIFIEDRLRAVKLGYWMILGLSVLLLALGRTRFLTSLKKAPYWESISIIGLLVSIFYFTAIPPLQIVAGTELFEQANHGMLVNDVLVWGKIPIVNSFDGHMLANSLGGLVYGLLNGDVLGASYFNYAFVWLIPQVICLFLIYKNVFGMDFAFFFMLIAPSVSTLGVKFGVISIIALLYAAKKRSTGAYLWFLFSVVISTVYEAPTGISYGGGALLVMVFLIAVQAIQERKFTDESKMFLRAIGVFAGIMVSLWSVLCLIQRVNPIKRAIEFIGLAQSTNNWTYASIGDNTNVTFALMYSILPLIVVSCLIGLIVRFQKSSAYLASAAFLLAYILNFTRALGRHSLAENQIALVIWTAVLGIALFAATMLPKWKCTVFIITGVFITTAIFNLGAIPRAYSVANNALITVNNPKTYYNGAIEKTTRVDLSVPLNQYKNVLNMINSVIPKDETYFDLSNQTMLYALSGREKPVYINQSALHLSGEYTQERFIEEVVNYDGICDFALMLDGSFGSSLDGVVNSYRYYKVYEYLYENFRPLCKSSDNFALWVRKDRYKQFSMAETKEKYATIPLDISAGNMINDLAILSTSPLVLQCGNEDPFISFPLTSPTSVTPADGGSVEIKIVYKSTASGMCQMFFDYAGFNETDSTRIELAATQEYVTAYFAIPIRQDIGTLNSIRLDPPKDSVFEVHSINIVNCITPIDYDYLGIFHTTNLGQIPYVWGQYDNKKAWNNTVVREYETGGEISAETQQSAKYVMLTFYSETDGIASLSFRNFAGQDISTFNFSLLRGHNRYIIRASTDWWWNSGSIASFAVSTDNAANLRSIHFLAGD